jgi:hypothetical protein
MIDKLNIVSDMLLDRKEDIYSYIEFGKIVNRFIVDYNIYSNKFWDYIKDNFNVKQENITLFCDFDVSSYNNSLVKKTKYIIKIDKPDKIVFYIIENDIGKISRLFIYFDYNSIDVANKIVDDIFKYKV